jgi:hypothetical protein
MFIVYNVYILPRIRGTREVKIRAGLRGDITDSKPFVSDEEMSDVTIPFQARSTGIVLLYRSNMARKNGKKKL